MSDVIRVACHRTGDYQNTTSADLVTAITQSVALQKTTLLSFFQQIIAAGGVQAELAPLYDRSRFIDDMANNLEVGDLAAVSTLVSLAQDIVTMTQPTVDAINTVITSSSLRLVDVVAAELGQVAPGSVTPADVDTALGR
jgi:hypothetical protein